jgi:hypothetical protein
MPYRAWPRILAAWLCLTIAVLVAGRAEALPSGVQRASAPAFVRSIKAPPLRDDRLWQVDGGIYDLLWDTQVQLAGITETTYRRRVYKIVNRSGLEDAAQLQANFDPAYESLIVHQVRILRAGRIVDITAQIDVDSVRRENELDDGVLTGVRTVVLRIPDVRVGDIVDASWSWVSRPPLWPGHYFGTAQLSWGVPVGLTHFRIDLPAQVPLRIYRYRGAPAALVTRSPGRVAYEWNSVDPDPIEDEDDTPDWFQPWQRVSLSTMRSWGDVVDWALPFYRAGNAFPSSLEGDAARIERQAGSPEAKAIQALRLVQDKIRYTSMSIGPGSYAPRSPAVVVKQGWGDCKDKSQLLVVLLGRLGIEAWPALTDTKEGLVLDRAPPAPLAFDHVIVQARIGGKTYWLDPTIDHQGGSLAGLAPLTYRKALPIRAGQQTLEDIPLPRLAAPDSIATETYERDDSGIHLNVETLYIGAAADRSRAEIARKSVAARERLYFQYYAEKYPGLRAVAPLRISDDRDANRFRILESYFLPARAYADGRLLRKFPIQANMISQVYGTPGGERTQPLNLPFPVNREHRVVLITPGGSVAPPGDKRIDGKAFDFRLSSERSENRLTMNFSLVGKSSLLAPKDFADFKKESEALYDNDGWNLRLDGNVRRLSFWQWAGIGGAIVLIVLVTQVLRRRRPRAA